MSFSNGEKVVVLDPPITGDLGFVGLVGTVLGLHQDPTYLEDLYVVEFFESVRTFRSGSLKLEEEDVFDNVVPLRKEEQTVGIKHLIEIQGHNFMLTTKEARDLKNLLSVFV